MPSLRNTSSSCRSYITCSMYKRTKYIIGVILLTSSSSLSSSTKKNRRVPDYSKN